MTEDWYIKPFHEKQTTEFFSDEGTEANKDHRLAGDFKDFEKSNLRKKFDANHRFLFAEGLFSLTNLIPFHGKMMIRKSNSIAHISSTHEKA